MTKLHFLSAALWWYLFVLVMRGIGECNLPVPEGPFLLSQCSRARGLQVGQVDQMGQMGQRPVPQTLKTKLVEAIVPQAREE